MARVHLSACPNVAPGEGGRSIAEAQCQSVSPVTCGHSLSLAAQWQPRACCLLQKGKDDNANMRRARAMEMASSIEVEGTIGLNNARLRTDQRSLPPLHAATECSTRLV